MSDTIRLLYCYTRLLLTNAYEEYGRWLLFSLMVTSDVEMEGIGRAIGCFLMQCGFLEWCLL
jgi:hypothetical protein